MQLVIGLSLSAIGLLAVIAAFIGMIKDTDRVNEVTLSFLIGAPALAIGWGVAFGWLPFFCIAIPVSFGWIRLLSDVIVHGLD
jgi:hypothetical protein